MKRMLKTGLVACGFLLLASCGDIEWFPGQSTAPTGNGAKIEEADAGTYVYSYRSGARDYTVATTKGAFSTYTSLAVPVKTPVTLDTYMDATTGTVIGRTLNAGTNSIIVREILALVE